MTVAEFHGDRPIESPDEDRFGFGPLANRIAEAVTTQAANKSFVLGLEGKWGSGKSSLLALTLARLREMPPDRVAAIEFRPWLIGDRDQLLTALFEDFVKAIAALEHAAGDATGTTAIAVADVGKKVRKFASHLGPLGKLANIAGVAVPGASAVGDLLEKIATAAAEQADGPTLAEQKEDLADSLRKLNCRIVVAIDDVDRLEPKEVSELLRLVRSVADFPNVSYVLCYDSQTLAHAIEEATGVSSGSSYLEKIVQTEIGVPRPESFALRRWFSFELEAFARCAEERVPYLQQVISETGGRAFTTARAVVRVLDSLRVFWPSLEGRVDLPDLVWLRILSVSSPNLYRWIEEYLTSFASLAVGRAHISGDERAAMTKRLDTALTNDGLSWEAHQFELERHLPGINFHSFNAEKDERIFWQGQRASHFRDAQDKRLSSPSHSRLYFSLVDPPDSVTESDIVQLLSAAGQGVNQVAFLLLDMGLRRGDAGGTKAEMLLDQLRNVEKNVVEEWPIEALVMGLANVADEMARDEAGDEWGYPRTWYFARDFLKRLRSTLSDDRWGPLVGSIFQSSPSLAFLSYLLRAETFAHGFYGDRPDPRDTVTTKEQFEKIRKAMLDRFAEAGLDKVLEEPAAPTMLYAWSQAGGRKELLRLIATKSTDDGWFVRFVARIFSTSRTSTRSYPSLSLEALANFFESPVAAVRRAAALAAAKSPNLGANQIVEAVKRSIHFDDGDFESILEKWEQQEHSGKDTQPVSRDTL